MVYRFKKDSSFDAEMVMAVRKDLLVPFGIAKGMKPDELFARRDWLPKQSRQYLHSVELQVTVLERNSLLP